MEDTFMSALQRGYGLSRILDDMNRRSHDREVNGRIDEILAASNGGTTDLSMLDPKLYSDRIGMEAMGQVTQKLSQTGEYQNKIFQNSMAQAKNLYQLSQQYMEDFRGALGDQEKGVPGDEGRAAAILGNMMNRMNLPYRFVPESGGYRVYHVTPEGEKDMGQMSLLDLYNRVKDTVGNEEKFIRGSVAYNMTNAENNQKYFSDTSKWRIGVTKDGKQLAMVPQTFNVNGQMVGGFYVEGLGNRTLQQLADAGITVGGVTGAGLADKQMRARGRGLGGSRTPSSGDKPVKVTRETQAAYERAFASLMSEQGFIKNSRGEWGQMVNEDGVDTFQPVGENDAAFIQAGDVAHAQVAEALKQQGRPIGNYANSVYQTRKNRASKKGAQNQQGQAPAISAANSAKWMPPKSDEKKSEKPATNPGAKAASNYKQEVGGKINMTPEQQKQK